MAARKTAPRKKRTKAQVTKALRDSGGVVLRAAVLLDVDRNTVTRYLAEDPELAAIREEAIEEDLDHAEHHVHVGTVEGTPWAVKETLRLHGHRRGLVTRHSIEAPDGIPVRPDLSGVPTELLRKLLAAIPE